MQKKKQTNQIICRIFKKERETFTSFHLWNDCEGTRSERIKTKEEDETAAERIEHALRLEKRQDLRNLLRERDDDY